MLRVAKINIHSFARLQFRQMWPRFTKFLPKFAKQSGSNFLGGTSVERNSPEERFSGRLQGYGYNPFCSHSSRCLAVLVWQYFEEAFCAPKVRLKWYGFKGFPSHSSHCSGGLFPQYSGVSPAFNSKTKSERKVRKKVPKHPCKHLSPFQLPKSFSPALFHSLAPSISQRLELKSM